MSLLLLEDSEMNKCDSYFIRLTSVICVLMYDIVLLKLNY